MMRTHTAHYLSCSDYLRGHSQLVFITGKVINMCYC